MIRRRFSTIRWIAWFTLLFSGAASLPAQTATLASGGAHTCAIGEATGEIRCWGRDIVGQLGDGRAVDRAAPVAVSTTVPRWRAVVSGDSHSCAIASHGPVYCWGNNAAGQLGDGTLIARSTPVAVVGLTSGVVQIALGSEHSCALMQNGKVNCWGAGAYGRLGTGQTGNQTTPAEVLTLAGATAIGAGIHHTCAALDDGSLKCWGRNHVGQIGDGSLTDRSTPVFANAGVSVADIAIGGYHSCVRSTGGAMRCWGHNLWGQLGNGATANSAAAVNVDGLATDVSQIAAGISHTCARMTSGVLKCWGYNDYGQIGDGTTTSRNRPVEVVGLTIPAQEFSLGLEHSCARASGNRIHCWGRALYGRTGYGNTSTSPSYSQRPLPISGLPAAISRLSLHATNACAVTQIHTASCWGTNEAGQLGDGVSLPHAALIYHAGPQDVVQPPTDTRDIAVGNLHACALKGDGTVWCWGSNAFGQLGEQTTISRRTPVQVVGITNAVQVAASVNFSCARTAPGGVWCWGLNTDGQLGIGSNSNSLQAVQATGLDQSIVDISLGGAHACAARSDGKVLCWGNNVRGQLGDSSTTARNVPTLVNDGFGIYTRVAVGTQHSCGLTSAGQVKCWGYNHVGQLGDSTLNQRPSPAGVDTLSSGVVQVAAGSYHSCALLSSGQLKCWGYNANYQLGDGTTLNRSQPVVASNVSGNIRSIAMGGEYGCVRLADETTRCWGLGSSGQLGNGSIATNSAMPQQIAQWLRNDLIFRDSFGP